METVYRQTLVLSEAHTDESGFLSGSGALSLAQNAAQAHCDALGLTRAALEKKGLFWAIARQRLEITRLPKGGETVTVVSTPLPETHTAYPRMTVCTDSRGKPLFSVTALWVLMDLHTRQMLPPGKSDIRIPCILPGPAPVYPRALAPVSPQSETVHAVTGSDLDENGHVNNARYLDWVLSLLPHRIGSCRIDLCYTAETILGQSVHLCQCLNGDTFQVDGYRDTGAGTAPQRVFSARITQPEPAPDFADP